MLLFSTRANKTFRHQQLATWHFIFKCMALTLQYRVLCWPTNSKGLGLLIATIVKLKKKHLRDADCSMSEQATKQRSKDLRCLDSELLSRIISLFISVMREKLSKVQKPIWDLPSTPAKTYFKFFIQCQISRAFSGVYQKALSSAYPQVVSLSHAIQFILEKLNFPKLCRRLQIFWYHPFLLRSTCYFALHEICTNWT